MIGRVITLDPADDPASAADRIAWARASSVIVVMPAEAAWADLDFVRLRRTTDLHGVAVAIVAADARQQAVARAAGLPAFPSVGDAQACPWPRDEDFEPLRRLTPPRRFVLNSLARFFPRRRPWARLAGAVLTAFTLLLVASLALILAHEAKITLTASSERIATIVPVQLDVNANRVDLKARTIPAVRLDVVIEGRASGPATGEKSIPSSKARGSVTFINLLTTPYLVPRNTVVRTTATGAPVRFVTLKDVEVPPAGRASAEIEAIEAGPAGNVNPGQINRVEGVPALAVTVINEALTSGGGNVILPAVTEADYRRLRAELQEKLLKDAAAKMQQLPDVLSEGLLVLPQTLFIADRQDEAFDRFVGEQADVVQLDMRLQVAGLAVAPRDLEMLAREALKPKVPPGFDLLAAEARRGEVAEEGTGRDVVLFVEARGLIGAAIDESAVRRLVRGRTPTEAQSVLLQSFSLKRNPRIEAGPDWLMAVVNRLPVLTTRIQTRIERE